MAVPGSGTLTFPDDLIAEFGAPGGTPSFSDFLRGGGLVPDIPANSGVPTSLPATFPDDWYGATAATQLTLTIGSAQVLYYGPIPYPPFYGAVQGYGYDNGNDPFSHSGFGNLSPASYTDGGSNTRTIEVLATYVGSGYYAGMVQTVLVMTGASIPNTDTTFASITNLDAAVTLTRSSASYSSPGSYTVWDWTGSSFTSASGTDTIQVNI